jgi:hypothetical protein
MAAIKAAMTDRVVEKPQKSDPQKKGSGGIRPRSLPISRYTAQGRPCSVSLMRAIRRLHGTRLRAIPGVFVVADWGRLMVGRATLRP